jgi:hypothetical protein
MRLVEFANSTALTGDLLINQAWGRHTGELDIEESG